jgi:type II secretory ATPase GspE/PulE/Tfp pilus assembly ATPase PilB-like protein/8-oxo-dGTP pyrophosphatase MutT (NUDIX family)
VLTTHNRKSVDASPVDEWIIPILSELISPASIAEAVRGVGEDRSIWTSAITQDLISNEEILAAVSRHSRVAVADSLDVTAEAKKAMPERIARKYHVLPLAADAASIEIATSNPFDVDCERALAFVCAKSVRLTLASPMMIAERIAEVYNGARPANNRKSEDNVALTTGESVIKLVDRLVATGIEARASDIHLEPEENGIAVRHRIDGLLRHVALLPKAVGVPLVSRIKIMAKLDIADRLRPQGGHASVGLAGSRVDLRVSTLPASHGEKVVIRILDQRSAIRSLESLGLDEIDAPRMQRLLEIREGLVLVTGPTGSGKTTTLYSALKQIQQKGLNIITVEDPVEYRIPGIVQVQINDKAGLSFAAALRSILRQDPDVVLIGEIRDRETAAIAIQAALTGHLVFATLHTNDACSSITRLTDLGVDNSKLAAALKGIVAQRLIRRLCPDCRIVANSGAPEQLRPSIADDVLVYTPVGCDSCSMTGYRGRLAVTEIVIGDADLERAIAAGSSVDNLATIARRGGSRSLWESGIAHLTAGWTSGDELLRVLEQSVAAPRSPSANSGELWDLFDNADDDVSRYDSTNADKQRIPSAPSSDVTSITAGVVDVYVIRPLPDGWKVMVVQRALTTRCPGAWETIHGRIEPDESPENAAVREVREETGLSVSRLYNVTVQPFYLHMFKTVQLAVVFAAFVDEPATVTLGEEHQNYEWLSPDDAAGRFVWPREAESLAHIRKLLRTGDAGPVEDVLRVF